MGASAGAHLAGCVSGALPIATPVLSLPLCVGTGRVAIDHSRGPELTFLGPASLVGKRPMARLVGTAADFQTVDDQVVELHHERGRDAVWERTEPQ